MSPNEPADSGGATSGGILTSFDLGSAKRFVTNGTVDWRSLVAYLMTIAVLIVSETLGRIVSGVLALPRKGIDAVGDVYARLAEEVVGFWPSVFSTSFDSAGASLPDLGLLGFVAAAVFVVVWFLVLNELLEVL
ncbi:hypothetical protein [Halorubrum sp. Hd13]|uniref:hypothetical protein n=1 Tax=Halorubrum sp. Hd13 TaxID=1480728 RepID=UPI000BC7F86B|nr:hypothetical protein [Halorubrum sp. Hd13]OYR45267.1 hypothetical protein DJ81_05330 [Halorubrum sp. Hd13]